MKALRTDRVTPLLAGNDDLSLAGKVSKDAIDSLTRQIRAIEVVVEKKIDIRKQYDLLLSMPGVGRILALTIMMETGPIDRFPKVGSGGCHSRLAHATVPENNIYFVISLPDPKKPPTPPRSSTSHPGMTHFPAVF